MVITPHTPSEVSPKSGLGPAVRQGNVQSRDKFPRWCVHPRIRARVFGLSGACISRNVRVYEMQPFNVRHGFGNPGLDDGNVHVTPRCNLDLSAQRPVAAPSPLSPGGIVLTHQVPGSAVIAVALSASRRGAVPRGPIRGHDGFAVSARHSPITRRRGFAQPGRSCLLGARTGVSGCGCRRRDNP